MRELEKRKPKIFQVSVHSDLLCLWPEALIRRKFHCAGVIIITNLTIISLFLLTDKHFWVFEMTANLRDTSPLTLNHD